MLNIDDKNPATAAVMVLLYPKNNQTHVVLIVRPSYPGVHSSQISFPGGRYEADDLHFEQTAYRECFEEVGVHPDDIKIIKPLAEVYIPPSNFLVYPFLGYATKPLAFTPQLSEVHKILEVPLDFFINSNNLTQEKMNTSYGESICMSGWNYQGYFIWGATAMMLSELVGIFEVTK